MTDILRFFGIWILILAGISAAVGVTVLFVRVGMWIDAHYGDKASVAYVVLLVTGFLAGIITNVTK